jgi:hypothetical protein
VRIDVTVIHETVTEIVLNAAELAISDVEVAHGRLGDHRMHRLLRDELEQVMFRPSTCFPRSLHPDLPVHRHAE